MTPDYQIWSYYGVYREHCRYCHPIRKLDVDISGTCFKCWKKLQGKKEEQNNAQDQRRLPAQ